MNEIVLAPEMSLFVFYEERGCADVLAGLV